MNYMEIAQVLERIAANSNDWHSFGTELKLIAKEKDSSCLIDFVYSFHYMLVEQRNFEYYEQFGPLAPMITLQDRAYPPPLELISEDTLNNWKEVLAISKNPLICSRLSDLLWIRKWGDKAYFFAQKAVDSYLDLSKGILNRLENPAALTRALNICLELNDQDRRNEVVEKISDLCHEELTRPDRNLGVIFDFFSTIMNLPINEIPSTTMAMIDHALKLELKDPTLIEILLTHKIAISNSDHKQPLLDKRINLWIEEANKNVGAIRHKYLLHALELAKDASNNKLVEIIRLHIQDTSANTFEFQEVRININIPTEKIQLFFLPYRKSNDWKQALDRFGGGTPPSGSLNENTEIIKKQVREYPLQFLVTQIIYDKNNLPILESMNIDHSKEIGIIRTETNYILAFAQFSQEIINVLIEKHGIPSSEELTNIFNTTIISEEQAKLITSAILWYINGEYNVSSHLLIPVLESILRDLVRNLGFSIFREPLGIKPGRVIQLGAILDLLKGRMNEDWRRYFKNVLIEPIGLNLRNEICHGLLLDIDKGQASLLIHLACHLRLQKIEIINSI